MQTLREDIPYDLIKRIIIDCPNSRTKALIAFQYATGCRIGELLSYTHKVLKKEIKKLSREYLRKGLTLKRTDNDYYYFETRGLLKKMVKVKESNEFGRYLDIALNNFKASSIKFKNAFVLEKTEKWLYDALVNWVNSLPDFQHKVFTLRISRASELVDKELKKYNEKYSTHYLRHSRLTHLSELYDLNVYEIKTIAGHSSIIPSLTYVHIHKKDVLRKFIGKNGVGE